MRISWRVGEWCLWLSVRLGLLAKRLLPPPPKDVRFVPHRQFNFRVVAGENNDFTPRLIECLKLSVESASVQTLTGPDRYGVSGSGRRRLLGLRIRLFEGDGSPEMYAAFLSGLRPSTIRIVLLPSAPDWRLEECAWVEFAGLGVPDVTGEFGYPRSGQTRYDVNIPYDEVRAGSPVGAAPVPDMPDGSLYGGRHG